MSKSNHEFWPMVILSGLGGILLGWVGRDSIAAKEDAEKKRQEMKR